MPGLRAVAPQGVEQPSRNSKFTTKDTKSTKRKALISGFLTFAVHSFRIFDFCQDFFHAENAEGTTRLPQPKHSTEAERRQRTDWQGNVWQGNKTKRLSSHSSANYSSAKSSQNWVILTDCTAEKQQQGSSTLHFISATLRLCADQFLPDVFCFSFVTFVFFVVNPPLHN
jgi:hypothetical protein